MSARDLETPNGPLRVIPWGARLERADACHDPKEPRNPWYGGSWPEVRRVLECGDLSAVPEAERLLDRISLALDAEEGFAMLSSVCGGRLSVGAHLAGSPAPFRRRRRVAEAGPVTLVAELSCGAFRTASMLRNRGIAYLAIVLALQRTRPVQLAIQHTNRCQTTGRSFATRVELGTTPIDLADLAAALWHPGTKRRWLMPEQERLAEDKGLHADGLTPTTQACALPGELHLGPGFTPREEKGEGPRGAADWNTPEAALRWAIGQIETLTKTETAR